MTHACPPRRSSDLDIDSEALGRFWADPDCYPPPGGERWSAFVERVAAGLADLPPAPTLVVTHGGVVRAALHLLCGFGQRQIWTFDLPYARSDEHTSELQSLMRLSYAVFCLK